MKVVNIPFELREKLLLKHTPDKLSRVLSGKTVPTVQTGLCIDDRLLIRTNLNGALPL